ncbi:MAG: hypothetical protein WA952_14845 [Lewinella sp.]
MSDHEMSRKKSTSRLSFGIWLTAYVLLLLPVFPPEWEAGLFVLAFFLVLSAAYLRLLAVDDSDSRSQRNSLAGSCLLLVTIFFVTDLRIFGDPAIMFGGMVGFLLLAAYFAWRGRPGMDEQPA